MECNGIRETFGMYTNPRIPACGLHPGYGQRDG